MKDTKVEELITKVKDLLNQIDVINKELAKHDVQYTAKINPNLELTVSKFHQSVEY